jgi:hypothetical protein
MHLLPNANSLHEGRNSFSISFHKSLAPTRQIASLGSSQTHPLLQTDNNGFPEVHELLLDQLDLDILPGNQRLEFLLPSGSEATFTEALLLGL